MSDFVFTVSAQAHYDAAHFLRNYEGKCSRLHGHRYVVEAAVQAADLDDCGIAFDFTDLKKALGSIVDELDHQNLNELPAFQELETSAENQARYIYQELETRLPSEIAGGLLYTRVWEAPGQWAQYGRSGAPVPSPRGAEG